MTISGFTFMRNTATLYYPFIESLLSILPICDEFVIALSKENENDETENEIKKLNHPKIKIIHTTWDINQYPNGTVYAQQSNIALKACSSDWCFYLQSDELIHENDLNAIKKYCEQYQNNKEVEGFLFNYLHFYGSYERVMNSHCWYKREIRIVRNHPDIYSYGDAQSFRYIPEFDHKDYRTKRGRALNVIHIPISVYHYGWVRPPSMMRSKSKVMDSHYHSASKIENKYQKLQEEFDYGNLNFTEPFQLTHPSSMKAWIEKFNWKDKLHFKKNYRRKGDLPKHERIKYRILSYLENTFFNGRIIFGYKNWKILK